uniref:Uncharacterized protein n=1 Tax=Picea glauca TaxID=3330 RepID=A0A101M386_PICGL|nr:hypothetical protein ABT39_MTgene3345 [Picea glauca]QHR89107.1 hypothetical protein Q903MT_gene3126 [Picea sitchensis]
MFGDHPVAQSLSVIQPNHSSTRSETKPTASPDQKQNLLSFLGSTRSGTYLRRKPFQHAGCFILFLLSFPEQSLLISLGGVVESAICGFLLLLLE